MLRLRAYTLAQVADVGCVAAIVAIMPLATMREWVMSLSTP
jgi:hypothetical protein